MKNKKTLTLVARLFWLAIIVLILPGCLQSLQEYTVNPNGSGKVFFENTQPLENIILDEEKEPGQMAIEEVEKILKTSKGVDAWQDVSFKITEDGNLKIQGTAYFSDISLLDIAGSVRTNMWAIKYNKLADGRIELTLPDSEESDEPEPAGPRQLAKSDLEKEAQLAMAKFKQSLPLLESFLKGYKVERIFHLPGRIVEKTAFKQPDPQTVAIEYNGDEILKIISGLMDDEQYWQDLIAQGYKVDDGPPKGAIEEKLFGTALVPAVLIASADQPLFDFKKQVSQAKEAYSGLRDRLGLPKEAEMLPPAQDDFLKNVRVAGIQKTWEDDGENNILPFNGRKGYLFSIIGEFSGPILNIDKAIAKTAVSDTGENLLYEDDFENRINTRIGRDRMKLIFEVPTRLPSKAAKEMSELSGEIIYETGEGTKQVSLGMLPLAAGSKSPVLKAVINGEKESPYQKDVKYLEIELEAQRDHIKKITLLMADGRSTELSISSSSQSFNSLLLSLNYKAPLPEKGEIVLEMHENIKRYTIPFKLENIAL